MKKIILALSVLVSSYAWAMKPSLDPAVKMVEACLKDQQVIYCNDGITDVLKTFIGSFDQNEFTLKTFSQFYNTQNPEIFRNTSNIIDKLEKALNNRGKFLSNKDKIATFKLIENEFISYVVQNYGKLIL